MSPMIEPHRMTPADLKAIRRDLGLTAEGFARLVRVSSGRVVRRWEAGDAPIPGPVVVILELIQKSDEAKAFLGLA